MMDDKKHPLAGELHKLGNMRKRRGNDAFKNNLRAQLSEKAESIESKPKREWNFNFDWKRLLSNRMVPAISGALVLVLVLQVLVGPGSSFNLPIELVNVAEAQDYYTLTASDEDESGVDELAEFTLESKGELDAEEIATVMSISPETSFTVEQVDNYTVVLVPDVALESGELYQFELAAQNLDDAPYKKTFRWAYSVSDAFRVTGTHPGMASSGAPINTGIEIDLSHSGAEAVDFQQHFRISPEVNGSFRVEDKVVTFVPNGNLKENTIYTVTLNAELPLAGTDQTLGEDYVWQFETGDNEDLNANLTIARFEVISSDEGSLIPANAYSWDKRNEEELIDVQVYKYENYEDYLAAIMDYRDSVPAWASAAEEHYEVSNSGLVSIVDMEQVPLTEHNHRDHIQLPQALSNGYYLMDVQFHDAWEQSFIQVTDTASFYTISNKESLFWVNDLETGEPVKGATVEILGTDVSLKTDADGLAVLDNIYESIDPAYKTYYNLQVQITTDKDVSYLEKNFYSAGEEIGDLTWNMFDTDLKVYRPDDKVLFWGMVQGRDEALNGEAILEIDGGGTSLVEIVDGEVFTGKIQLVEAATGYHYVSLKMDDEIIFTDSIQVENYQLPAYEINLSTDQDAYFAGQTVSLDIKSQFFDGTALAHTELRVNDPDGVDHYVTTDADGYATLDWVSDLRLDHCGSTCYISYSDSFNVYPVQEELGDIQESIYVDIYRSDVYVDTAMPATHDSWEFLTYEVDLHNSYGENFGFFAGSLNKHISDTVATHGILSYEIERMDVTYTTSEYYDEVDKVTRQETKTETNWVNIDSGELKHDGEGNYLLDYDLDETKTYRIYIEVDDETGGYYRTSKMLHKVYDGSTTSYVYLDQVNAPNSGYSVGDSVEVQVYSDSSALDTEDDQFLFFRSQEGIVDYKIEDTGNHQFKFDKTDIPNVYVSAVRFDGSGYQTASYENIYFKRDDRRFDVSASTDKDEYAPGEEITLSLETETDANIHIQLVDEAYYSLYDEDLYDPLVDIYAGLASNIDTKLLTHDVEEISGDKGGCFVADTQILMADGTTKNIQDIQVGDEILTRESELSDTLVVATVAGLHRENVRETLLINGSFGLTDNHIIFLNGKWTEAKKMQEGDVLLNTEGEWIEIHTIETIQDTKTVYNFEVAGLHTYFADGHYVHNEKGDGMRTEFPTTAYFDVVPASATDGNTITFELPDSITEWRISVTALATGEEIYAGYTSAKAIVTKDAFITPILSPNYLVGDEPLLPVRAYGDELVKGQGVSFWLESESMGLGMTTDGHAFETTYFETGAMTEGVHDFIFGMESDAGDDSVYLETKVVESYFRLPQQEETELKEAVNIPGSDTSRTTVTFINLENGPVYSNLQWVLNQDGNRVDEALGRSLAAEWLMDTFGLDVGEIEFRPGLYQDVSYNGTKGITLFPYSDPSLDLSAQLAALAPERWNTSALEDYFESYLYSSEVTLTEKLQAVYGLTGIGENMLLEARVFEREFELTKLQKLWVALAYSEMGSGDDVTRLFLEIEDAKFAGEELMLLATLADYVASDRREALYYEALDDDEFNLLPSMLYSKQRLTHVNGDPVSFNLNGEKIEIEAGYAQWRSFTSSELDEIEISNVNGEILALSHFWDYSDPEDLISDDSLNIQRWYEVDGVKVDELQTGDVVEVHFELDIEPDTSYRLLDYLPSGLQPLSKPYRSWYDGWGIGLRSPYLTNQQEVNFFAYCNPKYYNCDAYSFYYLARVVNPGEFTANPSLLQEFSELDHATVGDETVVSIQP